MHITNLTLNLPVKLLSVYKLGEHFDLQQYSIQLNKAKAEEVSMLHHAVAEVDKIAEGTSSASGCYKFVKIMALCVSLINL